VARDGDSMYGSSRRVEVVGRQMELDERCRVWGCARASCVCAVQSSSKSEDNWTCVCAANQPRARLELPHLSSTLGSHQPYVTERRQIWRVHVRSAQHATAVEATTRSARLRRTWSIRRTVPQSWLKVTVRAHKRLDVSLLKLTKWTYCHPWYNNTCLFQLLYSALVKV
jgi:hypothetical protein